MNPLNADGDGLNPDADFMSEEDRAAIFSEAAAEFERLRHLAIVRPNDRATRLEAAEASVRYINELAIADRHSDVAQELAWLADIAIQHSDDTELAVIVATGMFDHVNNLGVAQQFDEATSELKRLKSFVARYPDAPDVLVRAASASENLEGMMGWEESMVSPGDGSVD